MPGAAARVAGTPRVDCRRLIRQGAPSKVSVMAEHRIFPHGELREIADNLWQLRGSLPFPLPRNMTVHRLPGGELLLHSVIALDDDGMKKLEALGKPAWMLVPHPLHTMDAAFYKQRYPRIRVIAHDDARNELGSVSVDFSPEAGLAEIGARHHVAPGMRYTEVVLDVPVDGGRALVFTDLVAHGKAPSLLLKLLGAPGGSGVPRIVRFRQVSNKPLVRGFLAKIAETPDVRIVATGHTPPIEGDCASFLRVAATTV
jgi:hypothetical protein